MCAASVRWPCGVALPGGGDHDSTSRPGRQSCGDSKQARTGGLLGSTIHSRHRCARQTSSCPSANLSREHLRLVGSSPGQQSVDASQYLTRLVLDVSRLAGVSGDAGEVDDVAPSGCIADQRDAWDGRCESKAIDAQASFVR